jgi:GNAT superfamily N-acetyltransferase
MYGFVRGRQLDGTYPGDAGTGVWPITAFRVGFGWGMPSEEAWPKAGEWPPSSEPPNIDSMAKRHRSGRYQRVRTFDECRQVLGDKRSLPVLVSLDITNEWFTAPNGKISAAALGGAVIGSHSVLLIGHDDQKAEFRFQNSWGEEWGDGGFGHLSYEVFEQTWWEGWLLDWVGGRDDTPKEPTGFKRGEWGIREHGGGIFHCREFVDPNDERIGWMFAIERKEAIEVEELFVRPGFRQTGHGKRLLRLARELAAKKQLPLKIWISYADDKTSNLQILEKMISPLGLEIAETGLRWAPLVATTQLVKQDAHPVIAPPATAKTRPNPFQRC